MNGVLGLGSSGSAGLTADVIEKLKEADTKAHVEPIEKQIENWDIEVEQFSEIEAKLAELLESAKKFDLFSTEDNSFEQLFATTTGTSTSFDATDTGNLKPGTISVKINELAQKDVHVSGIITDKDAKLKEGTIGITIGTGAETKTLTFETANPDGTTKTYDELVEEMNRYSELDVALEQVSDTEYRMVIKSSETGLANKITITDSSSILGAFKNDIKAQNMTAKIDGVDYNLSSNKIVMQSGLTITALTKGESSVEIQRDTSGIEDTFKEFITNYNDLVDLVEKNTLNADAQIQDTATIRSILSTIKDTFFGTTYGEVDPTTKKGDKSMFNYGLSVDSSGYLSLDSAVFNTAIVEDFNGLKSILIGTAENKGIGTAITEYTDSLDSFNGLLTAYGDNMATRRDSLEIEKNKAVTFLDNKYNQMTAEFAAYTAIISQFENSFSGLQSIIAQSTASN